MAMRCFAVKKAYKFPGKDVISKRIYLRSIGINLVKSIAKIDAIENNDILIQSWRINIGGSYRQEVIDRVVNKKLWNKGN